MLEGASPALPGGSPDHDPLGESVGFLARVGRVFAVIDGARIDDLQRALHLGGLDFRPLYLDERDAAGLAAGPHLVPLPSADAVSRVRQICAGKPALVFWGWPEEGAATTDALYKHLRGIGLVEIPAERDDAPAAGTLDERPSFETVLFRHADSNVLANLLPVLDSGQLSRLFGRATGLAFEAMQVDAPADARSTALYAPRRADWPPAPRGRLRIGAQQYAALAVRQQAASSASIASYLRRVAGPQTAHVPDEELNVRIDGWLRETRARGVQDPGAQRRWCYMQLVSGGALTDSPDVDEAFAAPWGTPDQKVWLMMQHVVAAVRGANRR